MGHKDNLQSFRLTGKMKIGAIIQARTSSTRLPRKILLELPYGSGITVLQQVIRRIRRAKKINEIIVATTTKKADDIITKIAKKEKVKFFRGSEKNVLERHYLAARKFKIDIIVRVTSDCPCVDPETLDKLINLHIKTKADFTTNCLSKTFPHGIDAEVYNFFSLEKAYINAIEDYEKEGVSEYIYKTRPKDFKIKTLKADKKTFSPDIRITLDTLEDYALLCAVFHLLKNFPNFGTEEIIKLFQTNPWLYLINKRVVNKKLLLNTKEEIKEAIKILKLQELEKSTKILEGYLNRSK